MVRPLVLLISSFIFPLIFFSLSFLFYVFSAWGHRFHHKRSFFLSVGRDRIELSVVYRVPPGDEARKLRVMADKNRDGFIDSDELKMLGEFISLDAMKGFKVTLQGRSVNIHITDLRIDMSPEANSSFEINAFFKVPVWLSPAPPPPSFKIGLYEDRFEHSHVSVQSSFRVKIIKGELKYEDGVYTGEIKRAKPVVMEFQW